MVYGFEERFENAKRVEKPADGFGFNWSGNRRVGRVRVAADRWVRASDP